MKAVVWKSHGHVSVFAVDSEDQLRAVKHRVLEAVEEHYNERHVEDLRGIDTCQSLVWWVNTYTDYDDNFEYFDVVEVKE